MAQALPSSSIPAFTAVVTVALLGILTLTPRPTQASPLSYLNGLCTMQEAELDEAVESMVQQLRWTRRFSGPGSQYRKHIEGHAGEIMEALEATQTRTDCSEARKSHATNLWATLSETRNGY